MTEEAVPPAEGGPVPHQWSHLLHALIALVFLACGVLLVLYPYTTGHEMPGDLIDSRFNLSMLEFFYHNVRAAVHSQPTHFLSAPFFYPWPHVTSFSDTFWGDAEIYALFRAFGIGPLTSYRAWFVAGFVLTYVATFISLRKLGLGAWGAAAGAFLFTFPLPMASQFDHTQLAYRLWIPPAFLAAHVFLSQQSLRAGASCLLFVALQLAASIYLGLFLVLLLGSYAIALCVVGGKYSPIKRPTMRVPHTTELVTAAILLALALVILAIVGIPYLDAQSMYGIARRWQDVVVMLPRPGSYLLAGASLIWPHLSKVFAYPFEWEHQLFPGFSAIIGCAWFLLSKRARARQPLAGPLLATAAILVVLTIDFDGHRAYPIIYLLPGFSAIRAVTRVILVIMLPLAAVFGMMVDELVIPGAPWHPRSLLAIALSWFLVVECSMIYHYSSLPGDWNGRLEALEAKLPKHLPQGAVLAIKTQAPEPGNLQMLGLQLKQQSDADVAAVTLGIRTLNGYSGNIPPGWKPLTMCSDIVGDLRAGRHFLIEHDLPALNISDGQLVLVGFGACVPTGFGRDPTLQLGRTYNFPDKAAGNKFSSDGLSVDEKVGRPTGAKNAFLFFSLAEVPTGPIAVTVQMSSVGTAATTAQNVIILANGQVCGRFSVTAFQSSAQLTCPSGSFKVGNNVLRLKVTPYSPQSAVRLITLTLTPHI